MSEMAVRAYASTKRFGAATLGRWLACARADQDEVLRIAEELRLGENHVRDVLDALEAVALRRTSSFGEILSGRGVEEALRGGSSRNERLRALKHALRRLQFPQLTAAEARLRSLVKDLGLPSGVTVSLPENLEGDAIVVTIRAGSAAELRRRLTRTVAACGGDRVEEIYRVLGGEW